MNNQEIMSRISELQGELSKEGVMINAPCGNEPIISLLGGIYARASINESRAKDKYPHVGSELQKVEELIELMKY